MYKAMKALQEVQCNDTLITDHIPQMGEYGKLSKIYELDYVRAL